MPSLWRSCAESGSSTMMREGASAAAGAATARTAQRRKESRFIARYIFPAPEHHPNRRQKIHHPAGRRSRNSVRSAWFAPARLKSPREIEMSSQIRHQSYWNATAPRSDHPPLTGELQVDVAIIGGGIVGVTTARMLKGRGVSCAVVEARRIGEEVTGKSTAKITSQHNIAYTTIERKFGEEGAHCYAEANEAGVRSIVELAGAHGIECNLERKAAFTYTNDEKEVSTLEKEAELARVLGLPASLTRDTGLPFEVKAAMRWDAQAQFHPVKYVKGLAATLPGDGCHVFENSRVVDWHPDR